MLVLKQKEKMMNHKAKNYSSSCKGLKDKKTFHSATFVLANHTFYCNTQINTANNVPTFRDFVEQ